MWYNIDTRTKKETKGEKMTKNKIGVIKIDPDEIRQDLLKKGYSYQAVWNRSREIINFLVDLYKTWNFKFIIFFGAPGSGKSHFIKNNNFRAGTVIIETSGVNAPLNKILKNIPNAYFIKVKAAPDLCKKRIKTRHKEFGVNNLDIIMKSVDRFNKCYNPSWLLEEDKVICTVDERYI